MQVSAYGPDLNYLATDPLPDGKQVQISAGRRVLLCKNDRKKPASYCHQEKYII